MRLVDCGVSLTLDSLLEPGFCALDGLLLVFSLLGVNSLEGVRMELAGGVLALEGMLIGLVGELVGLLLSGVPEIS